MCGALDVDLAADPGRWWEVAETPTAASVARHSTPFKDGSDAGHVTYGVLVKVGEEILVGNGRRFRVLAVVPFKEEDESPFVGLLQVETA